MDDRIRQALDQGQVIDITTTGRQSREPRRIEIVFQNFDGHIYISGMPRHRKRSWIANLEADPELTVHLKDVVRADLPATARIIDDETERRQILALVARAWRRTDVDEMVAWSPLIEVIIPGYGEAAAA
jgi:deazaflavin-dependent oxidoreductase (nitroreductase family)